MTDHYEDIVHLQHPTSSKHPRMAVLDRAAQFSPFAALSGYEYAIRETARWTEEQAELDEDQSAALDRKLRLLVEHLVACPEVSITFFQADDKKRGGSYKVITGRVKKIDISEHAVIMMNSTRIPITDICEITGSLFAE